MSRATPLSPAVSRAGECWGVCPVSSLHPPPTLQLTVMTRLSYVKTDSFVSLGQLEEEDAPAVEPPVFVFGVDHQGAYLRHRDKAARGEIVVERRINCGEVTTLLRLESSAANTSKYLIILDTNHQAFNKPRSSTARSLKSFYYFCSILKVRWISYLENNVGSFNNFSDIADTHRCLLCPLVCGCIC